MTMMLSRAVQAAAAVTRTRSAVGVAVLQARAFASDAADGDDKKPKREQRTPRGPPADKSDRNQRFAGKSQDGNEQPRAPRTFSFALKDKTRSDDTRNDNTRNDNNKRNDTRSQYSPTHMNKDASPKSDPSKPKKFSFAPSVTAQEQTPELEVFDAPAYWDEDFPANFDDSMKHEVEKLEVFADFTMLMDSSWQKEIHPLFDGEAIDLVLNAPLEDFDEHLFMDDRTTFDTKVVMEVPLSCFVGLSREGIEFVKQLAGPRYQANKKQLKVTEDRYRTRVHNHKRLCDILRDLTQTAHELATAQANAQAKQ